MRLHEVQSRIEENSPLIVDRGHPDWQMGRFKSRAQAMFGRFCLTFIPDQEANVVSVNDANFFFSIAFIEV